MLLFMYRVLVCCVSVCVKTFSSAVPVSTQDDDEDYELALLRSRMEYRPALVVQARMILSISDLYFTCPASFIVRGM